MVARSIINISFLYLVQANSFEQIEINTTTELNLA